MSIHSGGGGQSNAFQNNSQYQKGYYNSPPILHVQYDQQRGRIMEGQNSNYDYQEQSYSQKMRPILYPIKEGNFDLLYSEEGDGEILVETMSPEEGGHLRLITCVDISTLYKEKRNKAIEIAKEYQKLQHPNLLCTIRDFELLDNNGTLMFYTEAPDHIAGWKSYCKKKFSTDEMLCIFRQLCEALAYVHDQGLIHRDVHPTRIHSSFGLAKFNLIGMPYNYKKLLKKDNFCGHVNYSAPELIQEKQTFSPKVDIWSLGCCLYYLCTKKDPFEGRNPYEIKQNIMYGRLEKFPSKFEPVLKTIINKCLEKDEYKRASAREMLEFMDQLEIETYGEARSAIMVKAIIEEFNHIQSQPIVHKVNEQSPEYIAAKYNNPQFFQNSRHPYQSQVTTSQYDENEGQDSTNAGSMQCKSPQSMEHREYSNNQYKNHSLYQFSQNNVRQGSFQKNQQDTVESTTSSQKNIAIKKAAFQQDFKNQGLDQNISQFARNSVRQNFQNNLNEYYHRHQFYQGGVPTLQQVQTQNKSSTVETAHEERQTNNYHLEQNQQHHRQVKYQDVSSQPHKSSQPHQIILPKQEQIQRQMKQHQDRIDPPLPPMNTKIEDTKVTLQPPVDFQGSNVFQRYNLTQMNLDLFNSQIKSQSQPFIPQKNSEQHSSLLPQPSQPPKTDSPPQQTIEHKSTECIAKVTEESDSNGMPYSIFNTECIFANVQETPESREEDNEILKDSAVILQQEDNPSSGESRNELNKDEIEGIVAQIVESSKRVKNQLIYYDGTKYVGEVMRHGRGIYYDQDGSIYDGEWYEDQRCGKGKVLFPDGSVYDGQWEADKIHGKGIYLSSNGDRYEGCFNLGMKEGYGAMYYRNGNTYQGYWRNDQLWGQGVFHFKNGNYYEGSFVNGNFEGQGLMFFVGVGAYKGCFSGGNLEGIGRFEYLNGAIYDGDWKENKKHGRGKFIEADGRTVYNGDWDNDFKHGRGNFLQQGSYIVEGVWNKGSLVEMTKFNNYN